MSNWHHIPGQLSLPSTGSRSNTTVVDTEAMPCSISPPTYFCFSFLIFIVSLPFLFIFRFIKDSATQHICLRHNLLGQALQKIYQRHGQERQENASILISLSRSFLLKISLPFSSVSIKFIECLSVCVRVFVCVLFSLHGRTVRPSSTKLDMTIPWPI